MQSGTGKLGGRGPWEMLHDKAFCTFGISYLGVRLTIHEISLILQLFFKIKMIKNEAITTSYREKNQSECDWVDVRM